MVVFASCVLYNYLCPKNDETSISSTYITLDPERLEYLGLDGAIMDLDQLNGYRSARESQIICDTF